MGRSDDLVFPEYSKILQGIPQLNSVAFLGSKEDNRFTATLQAKRRDFYDLQLGNWNINSDWTLPQKYDLIVCTRCAYFSNSPDVFVEKCKSYLAPKGHALIDWGLGDHWRFSEYKVGWVRNGEHEFAYDKDNFLFSCLWRQDFEDQVEVKKFWGSIRGRFGYTGNESLTSIVASEIPKIVDYQFSKIRFKHLWYDSPQLYIMTLIENEEL